MDSNANVKKFIEQKLLPKGSVIKSDTEALFSSGAIDSLGVLELIAFLEKEFKITIDTRKHELRMFDNLQSIMEVVSRLHTH